MRYLTVTIFKNQVFIALFLILSFSCSDEDLLPDAVVLNQEPSEISSDQMPVIVQKSEAEKKSETETDSTEASSNVLPADQSSNKVSNIPCSTGSSSATEAGAKVWCWGDINIPSDGFFDDYKLFVSSHCSSNMVKSSGGRVQFQVNPISPVASEECGSDYNYRAEIREHPSDVDYPIGTEQWWGFDYKFEDGYVADELPWILWQTHGSFSIPSNPMTSIQLGPTNYNGSLNPVGELFVVNNSLSAEGKFTPVGVVPRAGQTLKIVIHLVWGDESNGLYEVWVDGKKIYRKQERTVYVEKPYGGYWKIGVYKWRWQDEGNVAVSNQRGISEINTSIGTLRTIMRRPGDPEYGDDSYTLVAPD
ncbi:heparin lyase I family protein [Zobellia uliginosa]|uniref:heparin lyase I family protein n=1 Tax=Zobellia uliginosa TaxID=143224 RepID=UPI001C0688EB|nr:heparin lyase I family protein [Zobellia uliginosa]MBU2948022.1 polysaccharide lyase [Zobellia uliginosa]